MPTYRNHLPQLDADLFLTDGGIETTLIFDDGFDLPDFAAFGLLDSDAGRAALNRYFDHYVAIAGRDGVGIVLETPTWRASPTGPSGRGSTSPVVGVNHDAVALLQDVRRRRSAGPPTSVVVGLRRAPRRRLPARRAHARRRGPQLPHAAGPVLRRSRRRPGHGDHDDLPGRGRRRRRGRPPGGDARRHLVHHGDRRRPAVRRPWARRSRPSTKPPGLPRVLHGQLRPPLALRGRPRPGRAVDEADPGPAGQRLDGEPRRTRRRDRSTPATPPTWPTATAGCASATPTSRCSAAAAAPAMSTSTRSARPALTGVPS